MRRRFLLKSAAAACCARLAGPVRAAAYPARPVRLIVPFSPGGNADLVGRAVAARMGDTLGQPIVVENRPGAGGGLGAEAVARSAADGYTLLDGTNGPLTVLPVLQPTLRYDVFADFAPVALYGSVPHVLLAGRGTSAATLPDLLALARTRPVTVATSGLGSATHLTLARLAAQSGVALQHVPYRGGNSAVADVLSGIVDAAMMEFSAALGLHRSGKARVLAVASLQRPRVAPDIHTFNEEGVQDFTASSFVGLLAPAGTPAPVTDRLHAAAAAALAHPAVLAALVPLGFEVADAAQRTPAGFATLLKLEFERHARIVQAAGIRLE